jgi:DNA repair protein RadC
VLSGSRTLSGIRPDSSAPVEERRGFAAGTARAQPASVHAEASSIKRLPSSERPRERLLRNGREALSEAELVALLLGGNLRCASDVVESLGGARGLSRAEVGELRAVRGVGFARACQLVAAFELVRRSNRRDETFPRLSRPIDAAAHLGHLADLEQEELHVLALDGRHRLRARFVAARGSANVVHVSPRDVLRRLVREGAAAAIVAHNHPAGDPTPSEEDVDLTHRLRAAGEIIGVPLVDHLVVASGGFFSFSEQRSFRR